MTLRAVSPGERAKAKKLTVTQAAKAGRRDLLVALRDRVAETVEDPNCPPRDLAALSRRLQEIAKELHAIDSVDEEDDISSAAATADEDWSAI